MTRLYYGVKLCNNTYHPPALLSGRPDEMQKDIEEASCHWYCIIYIRIIRAK